MENNNESAPNTNTEQNSDQEKPVGVIDGISRITVNSTSSAPAKPTEPNQDSSAPVVTPGMANDITKPGLSAPTTPTMTHSNVKSKKPQLWTAILTVLLIIIVLGGVYGVYSWQHSKVTKLDTQVTSLEAQASVLNTEISTLQSSVGTSTTSQNVFKISELGIQFAVPANLADLTYVMNSTNTVANISTTNLKTLDTTCGANTSTNTALGSISKGSGSFPASTSMTLVKQFSGYYIAYTKPSASCSTDSAVSGLVTALTADFKTTFTTIIQSS